MLTLLTWRHVAIGVLLSSLQTGATPAGPAITREITRVNAEAQRADDDQRAALTARLARASAAVEAGRNYLAIYELQPAWEAMFVSAFVHDSRISTLEDFRSRWKSIGEPRADTPVTATLPAVVEAFAAAAEARGPATYRASLPYAADSDVASGLYYLGESRAVGAFAAFVRGLPWPSFKPGQAPIQRSLAAELDALDAEVIDAYKKMDPAQHPAYVQTSVTLKRARTLDADGRHAGALLEYLLARYRFSVLRPGPLPDPPAPERLAAARAALDGNHDHSIGQLFVQMAEAAAASTNVPVQRGAAVILDDVLPAYHAALKAPAGRIRTTVADPVTITLVRWPFT